MAYRCSDGGDADLRFLDQDQSIWGTQAQIAKIFGVTQSNVSMHLANIFADHELDEESNIRKTDIARSTKPVKLYSLDAIFAVGFRVNSKAASALRKWSAAVVRAYIEQGYVINEKALRESPEKLNKLAAEIRALRAAEMQVYAKVRECFKVSAADYEPNSKDVRRFYALLQDKFHHAITGMTSSKIILDRADHLESKMGLQALTGTEPTAAEVVIGKNYLRQDELYRIHLLSEQFLLFAESSALAGRKLTMKGLHEQLDRLLTLNFYPVFEGYRDYIRDEAEQHAKAELARYRRRLDAEQRGLKYDEEDYEQDECLST
jgi:hypothetical protein